MPKPSLSRPTDAELAILNVLWSRGASTVREVYEELSKSRPMGYTTVLKFMQIMMEKGLLVRDDAQRTHIYRAKRSEADTQQHLVKDLLKRAFGGSARKLVMQTLLTETATPEELEEIRKFIDQMEGGIK